MYPELTQILENLLRYPPVEGSIASHEAWKKNVAILIDSEEIVIQGFHSELWKSGYISLRCRNLAASYLNLLTILKTG